MDFSELADKRYSCRKFSDKKVDDSLIKEIIETANKAPTAVNKQPVKVFWMDSDKAKDAIGKCTPYTFGAQSFLLVGYKEDEGWVRGYDKRPFADVDGSIVSTYIMMALKDLGLDTTWVGSFDPSVLKDAFAELKEYELIAIFPIGYKADDAEPSPRHTVRKDINDFSMKL